MTFKEKTHKPTLIILGAIATAIIWFWSPYEVPEYNAETLTVEQATKQREILDNYADRVKVIKTEDGTQYVYKINDRKLISNNLPYFFNEDNEPILSKHDKEEIMGQILILTPAWMMISNETIMIADYKLVIKRDIQLIIWIIFITLLLFHFPVFEKKYLKSETLFDQGMVLFTGIMMLVLVLTCYVWSIYNVVFTSINPVIPISVYLFFGLPLLWL